MRRAIAPVCWLLVSALGAAGACSSDGASSPEASAGADGTGAHAGAAAVLGGDGSGASAARAGAANDAGGVGETGGATAGGVDNAAAGAPMTEAGGAAGAAGTSGSSNPEPDLVTSSGGPWPDSLTGVCSTTSQVTVCPRTSEPFFGQDGTYRINVPSYTATTTTLTDSVTGLVWQLTPDQAPKTHAEALTYCEELQLAGQSDWRLPSLLEYVSVLDEGMGSGYAMPPAFGFDTVGAQWTASASGLEADQFFSMNDQYGEWTLSVEATPLGARCVRGTAPSGALLSQTDVVTDNRTGLIWQVTGLDGSLRTWQSALEFCEGSTHAGHDDWRLPSIKELGTLVDEAATEAPAIRAELGSDVAPRYWSSTPNLNLGGEHFAFALETSVGYSPSVKMTESAAAARCVRSEP